jgi:AcrR family transcriptional regulator
MPEGTQGTRRTTNVRVRGRAADVVARVMSATAHELGRVGYAALRVEDVAERSGVNKTTIYRRWPTKPELVVGAIQQQVAEVFGPRAARGPIDTGTLRGDLRASLVMTVGLNPVQLGILRTIQTERTVPEIDAVTRHLRDAILQMRVTMVERAIARGELPKSTDPQLVVDLVSAPVQRALLFNERIDAAYIDRVLDVVLAGTIAIGQAGPARRASKATRRATKKRR